jgi:hypothetical protein
MSLESLLDAWKRSPLKSSRLLLVLALADAADDEGWSSPKVNWLAERARVKPRQAQRILRDLEADGSLEVRTGSGRGHSSSYRLRLESRAEKGVVHDTLCSEKGGADDTISPEKGGADVTLSPQKDVIHDALSAGKGGADDTLSAPLAPPSPPFPPDPQYPLIPLTPPEEKTKRQETFGLRPLTGPQGAVFRVNLLLEEAGVPLPSPAQIGLWSKTLGGSEPLLELLGRLVQSGLANKRGPIAYVHRVVMEQATRPASAEPGKPLSARAGREMLRAAGADEIRWQQALEIIANTEES